MNTSDLLSLGLGILSVILGGIAICQALMYKKLQEKQEKTQEIFHKEQRLNLTYACIRNREIYNKVFHNGAVSLRKDCVSIFSTSKFNYPRVFNNLSDIEDLIMQVTKSCYCNNLIENITMVDIHKGDKICDITLRYEAEMELLKTIIRINEELDKYGLYLSFIIP